jgi:serine/threonine-protein kinase
MLRKLRWRILKKILTEVSRYKVRDIAYFLNERDECTKRKAFINHWNNAVLKPMEESDGFVYIIYTNDAGQTSKGWMLKRELIQVK